MGVIIDDTMPSLQQLITDLSRFSQLSAQERALLRDEVRELQLASRGEVILLVGALRTALNELHAAEVPADSPLQPIIKACCGLLLPAIQQAVRDRSKPDWTADQTREIVDLYRRLGTNHRDRHWLAATLAAEGSPAALSAFVELICHEPPTDCQEAALAFTPLFQRRSAVDLLFPRLWDALATPSTAIPVLDLANFLARNGRVDKHPGSDRVAHLNMLLGGLCTRLARFTEHPDEITDAAARNWLVTEGVTMVVVLCDALALIGNPAVGPKLHQAMALPHRRIRIEAAAALARLTGEEGIDTLVELAADHASRTRALHYLEELNLLDRVDEAWRSPASRAAGDLVAWLAEPTQFGLAPQQIELVDERRLVWPGYDQPVDCYLFDYEYQIQDRTLSGVGIAGPTTSAMAADLADLPPTDIYAIYAGWSTECDQIREIPLEDLTPADRGIWQSLHDAWQAQGYARIQLVIRGDFFGEPYFVASAEMGDQPGMLVRDAERNTWHPITNRQRPLGPREIFWMHVGRKLLHELNEADASP